MSKILDFLRQPRTTVAELSAARDELSVHAAEEIVNELEVRRRKALLDGSSEKEIESIEKLIANANRDVERTAAAIEELTTRIAEAEARERLSLVEQRHAENVQVQKQMQTNYAEMDQLAGRLAAIIEAHEGLWRRLHENNQFAKAQGRGELTLADPWNVYHTQVGQAGNANHYPFQFVLPGYRPKHPDGSAMGRIKNLRL